MFGFLVSLMTSPSDSWKRRQRAICWQKQTLEWCALKVEEGVTSQGQRRPLAAEKGDEADPPLEPPEEASPANTLTVAQWDPHLGSRPGREPVWVVSSCLVHGYMFQQQQETRTVVKWRGGQLKSAQPHTENGWLCEMCSWGFVYNFPSFASVWKFPQ